MTQIHIENQDLSRQKCQRHGKNKWNELQTAVHSLSNEQPPDHGGVSAELRKPRQAFIATARLNASKQRRVKTKQALAVHPACF